MGAGSVGGATDPGLSPVASDADLVGMWSLRSKRTATAAAGVERGAILVVVLILAVTFSVLSMALLSTAEISLRIQGNGQDLERAERGAQSGVEWAAAVVKIGGLLPASRTTVLDTGVRVKAEVRTLVTPNLIGSADGYGVMATVGADAALRVEPPPHALLSFADTSVLTHELTIDGSAYFGHRPPLAIGAQPLQMIGNLELATSTALPSGKVVHQKGATSYGVAPLAEPIWDTTRYSLAGNWTVPYRTISGTTTLSGQTLTGIVVVNLLGKETLTIDNSTIQGTLVVPSIYPPLLDLLGVPTIQFGKGVTITGGTSETGNLAILAPTCILKGSANCASRISGVTYVREALGLEGATLSGLLLLRMGVTTPSGPLRVERPAAFTPNVPHGIVWNGSSGVRLTWRGRQ